MRKAGYQFFVIPVLRRLIENDTQECSTARLLCYDSVHIQNKIMLSLQCIKGALQKTYSTEQEILEIYIYIYIYIYEYFIMV